MQDIQQKPDISFKQFILKVWEIYRPFKGVVLTLFLLLLLKEGLSLVNPYIYGKIIDGVITDREMWQVMKLILISLAIYLLNYVVLGYIKDVIETKKLDFSVDHHVANKTLNKLMSFSIGQNENQNSGIKKSIVDKGEHSLAAFAYSFIYDVLPVILQVFVALTAMFIIAPILGAIATIGVIVFSSITIYMNYILRSDVKKQDDMSHDISKKHSEILRGLTLIKVSGKEENILREYDSDITEWYDFAKKLWLKFNFFSQTRNSVSLLTKMAVMAVGVYLVYQKVYTPGFLIVFSTWSGMAFDRLNHLSGIHRNLIKMYVGIKNYFILMNVEPDIKEINNSIVLEKISGKIEFRDIYFKYPKREYIKEDKKVISDYVSKKRSGENYILKGIDLRIDHGQKVAIVGPSGAGKSTLIQLLIRSYDPDKGEISIDGIDLKNLNLKKFRSSLGIVQQDIMLFDDTLRYNIAFGMENEIAGDERLWEAVKMACVDKLVSKLEKGFDTIIGERGVKLSGGERQRVGIARALIKNPSILIFDEATSSLDTENEALIRESIEKASKGRTTIIIAHRLSTIKDADKIIVMEHGKIVGEGNHSELLQSCEAYQRLINNQTVMVGSA